jgi:hypothetical protein
MKSFKLNRHGEKKNLASNIHKITHTHTHTHTHTLIARKCEGGGENFHHNNINKGECSAETGKCRLIILLPQSINVD